MRCTACSEVVRPVVAIDIDGTLGDYHGHFLNFAEGYFGRQFPRDYDGSVELHEHMGLRLERYRDCKLAYRQGGLKRTMPRYSHATNLVAYVRRVAEVFITTTRPYLRLDQTDPDTREWLKRYDITYDGLLYHDAKYERLGNTVDKDRVVAILDDLPEQYDNAARLFGANVPILRRNEYNTAVSRPVTVEDLRQALDVIRERIGEWNELHGITTNRGSRGSESRSSLAPRSG